MSAKQKDYDFYNRLIKELIPEELKETESKNKDFAFQAKLRLSDSYLSLANLEYGLFNNIEKCKENIEYFKYYNLEFIKKGINEPSGERFSTTHFYWVLNALATGDTNYFLKLTKLIDDNADYNETPRKHGAFWFYRVLAWMILERNLEYIPDALERAKASFNEKGKYKSMNPYVMMSEAIWNKDEARFHEYLEIAAKKYGRQKVFEMPYEKYISWAGLGLCHLAKYRGMKVEFDHKYIPAALIN